MKPLCRRALSFLLFSYQRLTAWLWYMISKARRPLTGVLENTKCDPGAPCRFKPLLRPLQPANRQSLQYWLYCYSPSQPMFCPPKRLVHPLRIKHKSGPLFANADCEILWRHPQQIQGTRGWSERRPQPYLRPLYQNCRVRPKIRFRHHQKGQRLCRLNTRHHRIGIL